MLIEIMTNLGKKLVLERSRVQTRTTIMVRATGKVRVREKEGRGVIRGRVEHRNRLQVSLTII